MASDGGSGEWGSVFDIQRFCVQDGPGIRTTVFLKGCPLRCAWCHNPESWRREPQVFYIPERCIGCGACVSACPRGLHGTGDGVHRFERSGCTGCGMCAESCPSGALTLCGHGATAGEVLKTVLRDEPFYRSSGGGMTVSGGEPLMQPRFTQALVEGAKAAGLHVCVETCGYGEWKALRRIAACTDLFLWDFKLGGEEDHRRYTGVGNRGILENLRRLDESGIRTVLRCPLIEGVNLTPRHARDIAELAEELRNLQGIDLEPYHPLGESKRARLGMEEGSGGGKMLDRALAEEMAGWVRARTRVPVTVR